MAPIEGISGIAGLANAGRAAPRTGSAGFTLGGGPPPLTTPPAVAAADLTGLLALQEHDTEHPSDRAARRRSHDLLRALARLQRDLLAGDPAAALECVAALTGDPPEPTDPALAALLGAVMLRARVELARRERQ